VNNVVVVLTGLPGGGKSTVIKCFQEMGFLTKSNSNDFIQPHFVDTVNRRKAEGDPEYAELPYLSLDGKSPLPHLEAHEWHVLDYDLKAKIRPYITKHAWKMRENDPEAVAAGVLKMVDQYPAAIDSSRTKGDFTHFFDGLHGLHTYLLEIVASEEVRIARIGEEAVKKGVQPGSTEEDMIKMLDIYREKLAKDGRYIRLENDFSDVEHLKAAIKSIVLPKLK